MDERPCRKDRAHPEEPREGLKKKEESLFFLHAAGSCALEKGVRRPRRFRFFRRLFLGVFRPFLASEGASKALTLGQIPVLSFLCKNRPTSKLRTSLFENGGYFQNLSASSYKNHEFPSRIDVERPSKRALKTLAAAAAFGAAAFAPPRRTYRKTSTCSFSTT